MKLVKVTNVSDRRINVSQVRGLALDPGESTKVRPETVKHPAVARYIGRGLELDEQTDDVTKAEPTAPAAPVRRRPKPPAAPPVEPKAKEEEETEEEDDEDEEASGDLRETFVSAPGITESNVDDVMAAFPTIEALADADKDALAEAGISSAYTGRLLKWAAEAK